KERAAKAVAERGSERRDHRCRQQAEQPGEPDRRRTAPLVGEHAEGDEVHPLGCNRCAPRELGTPDLLVADRGGERRHNLTWPYHEGIESLCRGSNKSRMSRDSMPAFMVRLPG